MRSPRVLWMCAALGLLVLSGCKPTDELGEKGCRADLDCANGNQELAEAWRCEPQTGVCYCRTDPACEPKEFCNPSGFCQDRSGCTRNSDCLGTGLFCDTASGTCLPEGRCSTDLHCRIGQVCDSRRGLCVEGCRSSGDCNNTSCRCDGGACSCTGTTQAELAACPIGTCDPSFCESSDFCRFGEKCEVLPDAGSEDPQCFSDFDPQRRPYCTGCTFGGGTETCGRGANYCLVDTRNPGNYYCGVDCSEGQTCPRGYACQDVVVVQSRWSCSTANPSCQVKESLPCQGEADCPAGSVCGKASPEAESGFCMGTCGIDEGDPTGFCSCVLDEDCVQDACVEGSCSISRKACINPEDCRKVRCVQFGESRGCLIGQNCAPEEGLTCPDLLR